MQRASSDGRSTRGDAREPLRILVVDDDENLRFMLRLLFDDPSVEDIHDAANGEEALAIAERERPNVIVCDCRMPVMSGDEAGRRLRITLPDALIVSYSGLDADKPWADEAIIKASGDDIDRLRDTVLGHGLRAAPLESLEIRPPKP
ncbi:MAG: response regulator transcription factor [Actinomycetota bacterium]